MADDRGTSDEVLVERARNGDGLAFEQIVKRYEGKVASTVVGMLGPGPDSEDAGQETFIRFYRSIDNFRGDASLGTYLTRIAINQSLKKLKKRKRFLGLFTRPTPETANLLGADPETTDIAEAELVQKALREIRPEWRAVTVLRIIDGYSTRETAELLGIPEGTVMSRLSRSLSQLESLLTPHIADSERSTNDGDLS